VQNPNITLEDLVFGHWPRELSSIDRAILIDEGIRGVAELEAECERLRGEVADQIEIEEERDEAIEVLRDLVTAIEGAKIGKTARVGSLIVVGPDKDFASELGEALEKAKAIL